MGLFLSQMQKPAGNSEEILQSGRGMKTGECIQQEITQITQTSTKLHDSAGDGKLIYNP